MHSIRIAILLLFCVSNISWANPTIDAVASTPETHVQAIEGMTRYESRGIGFAGTPGRTYQALSALAQLGSVGTPYLIELTRSENPVARVAGIVGLGIQGEDSGRRVIEGLLQDTGSLDAFEGCIIGEDTVGAYARRTLKRVYGQPLK